MIYVDIDMRLVLREDLSETESQILKLEEMLKKYTYKFIAVKEMRIYQIRDDIPVSKLRAELKAGLGEKFFKIMKIERNKNEKSDKMSVRQEKKDITRALVKK